MELQALLDSMSALSFTSIRSLAHYTYALCGKYYAYAALYPDRLPLPTRRDNLLPAACASETERFGFLFCLFNKLNKFYTHNSRTQKFNQEYALDTVNCERLFV